MTIEDSVETEPVVPTKSPSILLIEARERLGLSQKEVADKLYLTSTYIKYIDDGEFARIPKPAYVRGYLRGYARVVELSGDEIVALYEAELQAAEPAPEIRGITEERVGTAGITGPVLQTGLIGLGALVLVIAFIWWLVSASDEETQPRVTQPTVSQPAKPDAEEADFDFVQPRQDEVLPAAAADQSPNGPKSRIDVANTVQTVKPAPDVVTTEADSVPVESTLQPVAQSAGIRKPTSESVKFERTSDGSRSFVTVDASGFDQLELAFRDECWVEIEDGQFGLIYNDLNRANDVLTIYGTAPFKVLLGKATGVEMIYNGRPFKLEPYTRRDQTAKLTVSG